MDVEAPSMMGWSETVPVVEEADVASVECALGGSRYGGWKGRALVFASPAFYVVCGLLLLIERGRLMFLGWVYLVLGLAIALPAFWTARRLQVEKLPAGTYVSLDDAGLTLSTGRTIAWKAIGEVRDVGMAFVFLRASGGRAIAIAKTSLRDEGAALWAELSARLTSTRYLVRGTSARTTIVNARRTG